MRIKIISLIFILLIIPMVSAQEAFVFERNTDVNVSTTCFDSADAFCGSSVQCNITVFEPDNTVLVDNQQMINNINYYNYPLNSTQTTTLGEHSSVVQCQSTSGPAFNAQTTFTFLITPSGAPRVSSGQGMLLIGSAIAIFSIFALLLIFGLAARAPATKFGMLAGALVMLLISSLYTAVILEEVVPESETLIDGFSTFLFVLKSIYTLHILGFVLYAGLVALKSWKIKRGLIDE